MKNEELRMVVVVFGFGSRKFAAQKVAAQKWLREKWLRSNSDSLPPHFAQRNQ